MPVNAKMQEWILSDAPKRITGYSLENGKMLFSVVAPKVFGLDYSTETTYVQGGEGNVKWLKLTKQTDLKIEASNAYFDSKLLATMMGNTPVDGAATVVQTERIKVAALGKVTLSGTPVGPLTGVFLGDIGNSFGDELKLGTPATLVTDYSITGKDITVNTANIGKEVVVMYNALTNTQAQTISIPALAKGQSVKLVIDSGIRIIGTDTLALAQFIVHKASIISAFKLQMSAGGDPEPVTFNMDALKDATKDSYMDIIVYDKAGII